MHPTWVFVIASSYSYVYSRRRSARKTLQSRSVDKSSHCIVMSRCRNNLLLKVICFNRTQRHIVKLCSLNHLSCLFCCTAFLTSFKTKATNQKLVIATPVCDVTTTSQTHQLPVLIRSRLTMSLHPVIWSFRWWSTALIWGGRGHHLRKGLIVASRLRKRNWNFEPFSCPILEWLLSERNAASQTKCSMQCLAVKARFNNHVFIACHVRRNYFTNKCIAVEVDELETNVKSD